MASLLQETLCLVAEDIRFSTSFFPGFKLILSLAGPFSCSIDGQSQRAVSGIIINRSIPHTLSLPDTQVLMYYLDYHSTLSPILEEKLKGRPYLEITQQIASLLFTSPQLVMTWPNNQTPEYLFSLADYLLLALFPAQQIATFPEGRIEIWLRYIENNLRRPIALVDLTRQVPLSIERTRHAFEEKTGMTFSKYILWMRIKAVIRQMLIHPLLLSETAKKNGFADQSHFNRMFKRTFGVKPHYLLKSKNDCRVLLLSKSR